MVEYELIAGFCRILKGESLVGCERVRMPKVTK